MCVFGGRAGRMHLPLPLGGCKPLGPRWVRPGVCQEALGAPAKAGRGGWQTPGLKGGPTGRSAQGATERG